MLDLQQQHTGLIDMPRIAQHVRASVVSLYPGRGDGSDEAMVDAGGIAFSKDTGPSGIFGAVLNKNWQLSRMSQEHGILTRTGKPNGSEADRLEIGEIVDIVGQHACMIAAAYPWYVVVDSSVQGGKEVVDVWVPWKGW
jgi:D-serine ammonia-lyase